MPSDAGSPSTGGGGAKDGEEEVFSSVPTIVVELLQGAEGLEGRVRMNQSMAEQKAMMHDEGEGEGEGQSRQKKPHSHTPRS